MSIWMQQKPISLAALVDTTATLPPSIVPVLNLYKWNLGYIKGWVLVYVQKWSVPEPGGASLPKKTHLDPKS